MIQQKQRDKIGTFDINLIASIHKVDNFAIKITSQSRVIVSLKGAISFT